MDQLYPKQSCIKVDKAPPEKLGSEKKLLTIEPHPRQTAKYSIGRGKKLTIGSQDINRRPTWNGCYIWCYKPSKYGWFISALQTWKNNPAVGLTSCGFAPCCSGAFLSLPPFPASRNMSNDAPKNAGAQRRDNVVVAAFRRSLTWIYSTALRKPWFNRGI